MRDYEDETLNFCLEDGAWLVARDETEPATAIMSEPLVSADGFAGDEAYTRAQIHTTVPEPQALPRRRAIAAPVALAAAAAVILIGGYFTYQYLASSKADGQIGSIAVMPFVNEGGNPDVEYLSDGMTETLIKSLSSLPSMDVRPRSAVFRYKGSETDLPTIGKELKVEALLSGRVVQRGEQLTLSLELVDVQKNRVIWSEQYQRGQSDLVSLQSQIARDVALKLSPKLTGAEETRVAKQSTANPEAYQAYLRGRFFWNKRTVEGFNKAIEQFQAAIDLDTAYALAYVGMADCYVLLPDYTPDAPVDSRSRSEDLSRRAIAIDGQLAEPHATLGVINHVRWQWADAESEFKRAIELDPNYATAYHWYSVLLFGLGRREEGAAAITRAHELDPMSNIISQNFAQMLQGKNDYAGALDVSKRMIELDPKFPGGYFTQAWSYLKTGRNEEAIASFQTALEMSGRPSNTLCELGIAYAKSGRTREASEIIAELENRYAQHRSLGADIAGVYGALGNKDKAFEWLEKDLSNRSATLAEFRWSLYSESLRDDPRFTQLLRRMGLPV